MSRILKSEGAEHLLRIRCGKRRMDGELLAVGGGATPRARSSRFFLAIDSGDGRRLTFISGPTVLRRLAKTILAEVGDA